MRSFEELRAVYDLLEKSNCEKVRRSGFRMSAIKLKRVQMIMEYLYPDKGIVDVAYVDDKWNWYFEGSELEDGEILSYSSLLFNEVVDRVIRYMLDSPYWDVRISSCYVDDYNEKKEDIIKHLFRNFFDSDVDGVPEKIISFFYGDEECEESICCIRSSLYPYVKELSEKAKDTYPQEVEYLDKAISVILDWLEGCSYRMETKKNGYFFCLDGNDIFTSTGYLEFREEMIVAAEMVESIVFKLDPVYHVLPESLRKGE